MEHGQEYNLMDIVEIKNKRNKYEASLQRYHYRLFNQKKINYCDKQQKQKNKNKKHKIFMKSKSKIPLEEENEESIQQAIESEEIMKQLKEEKEQYEIDLIDFYRQFKDSRRNYYF